jgi:hypothetical protein
MSSCPINHTHIQEVSLCDTLNTQQRFYENNKQSKKENQHNIMDSLNNDNLNTL